MNEWKEISNTHIRKSFQPRISKISGFKGINSESERYYKCKQVCFFYSASVQLPFVVYHT